MPTNSKPVREIPPPRIDAVDPKTGKLTKEWYELLKSMRDTLGVLRSEVNALIDVPPEGGGH
jgi:hypothetical protein